MKTFKQLNNNGFGQVVVLVIFMAVFAIGGVAYLIKSNAQTPPLSTNNTNVTSATLALEPLPIPLKGNTVEITGPECTDRGGEVSDSGRWCLLPGGNALIII